ncbi:hypothetical protein ACFYNY_33020 [Streptomyces sp. NPDC006530]|uniref:hypothetical protein n=1 Tax=Streptomyces sp. NPDC006530 TaxID=3364750 RepID=UPI00368A4B99
MAADEGETRERYGPHEGEAGVSPSDAVSDAVLEAAVSRTPFGHRLNIVRATAVERGRPTGVLPGRADLPDDRRTSV